MPTAIPRRLDLDRAAVRHGLALVVALAALLLRLWRIDRQPLWFDEAMTTHIVHAPDGLDYVHNTPPLYYWLLRAFTDWSGIGAAGLRSLSAVAGAGFVWASFHAARCAFGNRAALPTALLAFACPIHLYYSQEARAYSLLLFELMVALWMLWRLTGQVRFGSWIVLVVASAAALHTHYLAAIPLALAHVVIGLSAPAAVRRTVAMAVAAAGVIAALLLLPWVLWWSQRNPVESNDMRWLALLWSQLSVAGAFSSSTELLLLGGQAGRTPIFLKQFTSLPFADAARIAALMAMGLLLALFMVRMRHATSWRRLITIHCLVMFVGPLVGLWALSFARPIYCPGRYDLIALPGFVLLLGGAISSAFDARGTATKWLAGLAVVVIAAVLAAKDWCYFAAVPAPDPSHAVATQLAANVQPGETVVLCGAVGVPVLAQLYQDGFVWSDRTCRSARSNVEFGCRLLPPSLEAAPATITRYLRALEDGSLAAELERMLPVIAGPGIWLVLGEDLRTGGRDAAMEAVARRLFGVLHDAGYEIAGGEPALGVAHLRLRSGR